MMRKASVIAVTVLALGLMLASAGLNFAKNTEQPPGRVLSEVMPVQAKFWGVSSSELMAQWWQWALCQEDGILPTEDETGELGDVGQSGKFWFLAGTLGAGKFERTIEIPYGKAIFFPIYCDSYIGFPWDPIDANPEIMPQTAWDAKIAQIDAIDLKDIYCTIDGVTVPNLARYRANSGGAPYDWSFELIPPASSWLATAIGTPPEYLEKPLWDLTDGYWILLKPLTAGKHTITFGYSKSFDIIYNITVTER